MKNFIFILVILSYAVSSDAQWQKTFGPFGYEVTEFAVGNGMIISNGNVVNISTNNGLSWEKKSNGIWDLYCTSALISNSRLLVGMSEGNNTGYLFISDDNGANWEQVTITNNTKEITGFAKLGSNLYFCAYDNGIFKSTNNGSSWVRTAYGTPIYQGTCMAVMGSNLLLGTLNNGIYKSTDEGITWLSIGNPSGLSMVTSLAVKNNTLFATYAGWNNENGAYRTDNLGGSWIDIGQSLQPFYRSIHSDGINCYLATDHGVFKTTNDGLSWNQIFFNDTWAQKVLVYNGNIIVGTREVGIYTSTNNGMNWINTGNWNADVHAMCTYNNTVIVGNGNQPGFTISRNNGSSFTEFKHLLSIPLCFAIRGNDIYAGTRPFSSTYGGLYKSTDVGATWTVIGLAGKDIFSLGIKGNYIFAGSSSEGVFRTSNEGATWAQINTGLTQLSVKSLAVIDPLVYAGTNSGIYSTSNNGSSWIIAGLEGASVNALAVIGSQLFAGTGNGVYVKGSTGTWSLTGFQNTEIVSLRALETNLFAVIISGVYISTDGGINWDLKSQNLPVSGGCIDIAFNSDFAYISIGNNEGLYRRPLAEVIGINNISTEIPDKFSLSQNYPNPFNPATKIRFDISGTSASHTFLCVYDITGREIAAPVNEDLNPGTYEVDWDASKYTSGVYFYKLTSGTYTASRRMMLIK